MEVSWGANLVGMSMLPLDAYPLSLLIKKKEKTHTHTSKLDNMALLPFSIFFIS